MRSSNTVWIHSDWNCAVAGAGLWGHDHPRLLQEEPQANPETLSSVTFDLQWRRVASSRVQWPIPAISAQREITANTKLAWAAYARPCPLKTRKWTRNKWNQTVRKGEWIKNAHTCTQMEYYLAVTRRNHWYVCPTVFQNVSINKIVWYTKQAYQSFITIWMHFAQSRRKANSYNSRDARSRGTWESWGHKESRHWVAGSCHSLLDSFCV